MVVSVAEGLGEGRGDYGRFGGGTKGFSAGHAGSVGKPGTMRRDSWTRVCSPIL